MLTTILVIITIIVLIVYFIHAKTILTTKSESTESTSTESESEPTATSTAITSTTKLLSSARNVIQLPYKIYMNVNKKLHEKPSVNTANIERFKRISGGIKKIQPKISSNSGISGTALSTSGISKINQIISEKYKFDPVDKSQKSDTMDIVKVIKHNNLELDILNRNRNRSTPKLMR